MTRIRAKMNICRDTMKLIDLQDNCDVARVAAAMFQVAYNEMEEFCSLMDVEFNMILSDKDIEIATFKKKLKEPYQVTTSADSAKISNLEVKIAQPADCSICKENTANVRTALTEVIDQKNEVIARKNSLIAGLQKGFNEAEAEFALFRDQVEELADKYIANHEIKSGDPRFIVAREFSDLVEAADESR